jgi:hypothetical protein
MQILEFQTPIMFHTSLNPKLWNGDELQDDVRLRLLENAKEFMSFLKLEKIPLRDIIVTGSNTGFTYTPHSDLDLHIIVDMQKIYGGNELVEQFFDSKRRLWNNTYDIQMRGIPVEIYVEDDDETVEGNSYSLLTNEWVERKDVNGKTSYDDRAVRAKYKWLSKEIKRYLTRADSRDDITKLMTKIKNYRQSGLDKNGELSTENLVFKALRNNGDLERIENRKIDIVNTKLSLK